MKSGRRIFALAMAAAPVFAQGYLSGIALNKKIVTDFYRVVWEPRNADLIDQYIAADFVDHNPRIPNKAALVKMIQQMPKPSSDDIGPEMKEPPALVTAEGDLVTFIFKRKTPDSKDKSKTFDTYTFDTFRVKNGKIVEHWDDMTP